MDDANLDKPAADTMAGKRGGKALKLGVSQARRFERLDPSEVGRGWDVAADTTAERRGRDTAVAMRLCLTDLQLQGGLLT